jgi:hypothetical protein
MCTSGSAVVDLLALLAGFGQPWNIGWAMRAIAQIKPTISRAITVVTTTLGLPAASKRQYRAYSSARFGRAG